MAARGKPKASSKRGNRIKAGVTSPTAKRTLEQARKASTKNQSREVHEKTVARNRARRKAIKAGLVKRGDGKDVHHKDGNPRNNARSNLTVQRPSKNRALRGRKNGQSRGR